MSKRDQMKEMASIMRDAADILDNVAELENDTSLTEEQRDEKEELLLAQFLIKMTKIQSLQL